MTTNPWGETMPVRRVGKDAYRYGQTGKVYRGANAKAKAFKQAAAIKASQARAGKRHT